MFASDTTSDPLPSALTDYSYLNAAALLPISKVTKQIADRLNNMSKRMLLPGPNRVPTSSTCHLQQKLVILLKPSVHAQV
jgi:hypothetical protein